MADTEKEDVVKQNGAKRSETATAPARVQNGPFDMMRRWSDEMERAFGDWPWGKSAMSNLMRPFEMMRSSYPRLFESEKGAMFMPQIEVLEKEGRLLVRADLPGMRKEDVKVRVDDNGLQIEGERKQESEETHEGYYRSERSYGSFFRSIPLPEGTDIANVKAEFKDGVLEISMPAPAKKENGRTVEIS
jgi:HSP20 family protein